MKITDIKTVLLTGPSTNDPYFKRVRKVRSASFIEIHTDKGITGLGESYAGYFCPEIVPSIVEFFKPILIGRNPENVAACWRDMYHCGNFWCRTGLGSIVLAGIEAALWDLKGKMFNLPVFELLGGRKHDELLCYATGGASNYPESELLGKAQYYLSLGFKGFKVGAGCFTMDKGWYMPLQAAEAADFEGNKVRFLREQLGNDVYIMLDGHMGNNPCGSWNLDTALEVMNAVKPYNLFFFEEPLHYTDRQSYRELCRQSAVSIAGGECLSSLDEWQVFIENDAFDIGQPDASFTAMSEFMKVAAMLRSRNRKIATHAWGAGGSFMQNIHCGFAAENTVILEIAPEFAELHSQVIGESFRMKNGKVLPPETPGLGIQLSEKVKKNFPFVPGTGEFNSVSGKILCVGNA